MPKTARIAITMGDPAGVGPEIIVRAMQDKRVLSECRPIVVGDPGLLAAMARRLRIRPIDPKFVLESSRLDLKKLGPARPTVESSRAMIGYITKAFELIESGDADAMATAPISKAAAKMAGFKFPGHTEYIAHLAGSDDYCMMLGGDALKVTLVTIHEPIRMLPRLVTKEAVFKAIRITHESFKRYFGLKNPRIAICGLNPHAGEGGLFGDEEGRKIVPAIRLARRRKINAIGPLPADTVFYRAARKKEFDVVVAMYHDQGLGPLKLEHFEDGINVTLGLPVIRTSVDHGTAYDVAWKGTANCASLVSAILTAARMSKAAKKA